MEETYKILIAAAIGFILSPANDWIKHKISAKQSRKKLITKLKLSIGILKNSIPELHNTAIKREKYIKTHHRQIEDILFITPNLNFPNMEKEIEECYSSLSSNQQNLITIMLGAFKHTSKLLGKMERHDEGLREYLYEKYQINQEDYDAATHKKEANNYYSRILSCEKALIITTLTTYSTIEKILSDTPQLSTNMEIAIKVSDELGVNLRTDWWGYLK